ncbi:MAG: glucose-1-phosphate thymidylyltransferase [Anaerolinea sp.]|nr:glucose-1-phosphate thymidylyltransferase [Anaerolinea sp.]
MLQAGDFFSLEATEHAALFANTEFVWDAVKVIEDYVQQCLQTTHRPTTSGLRVHETTVLEGDDIYIGEGTVIEPGVYIKGPVVIGKHCEIRQGAYLRGNVVLGDGVVIGHTTELKNTVMLEHAHAPHFAYLGDSIVGRSANLGAGTKLSNLPVNSFKDKATKKRPTIRFTLDGQVYDTGLAKLGAILGDDVQTGCNCVLNPGCLIGPRTLVYPLMSLGKGYFPGDSVIKLRQQIDIAPRT